MTLNTNLNISPYFDDFDQTKGYVQVLFKPGQAVQTRELNALQSMLQNQIQQFGDNIYQSGTIISGCSFSYYPNYPYAKITDTQVNGQPVEVAAYVGKFAKNSANLVALILGANSGYVSQAPNLNTLYLKYLNSGNTGNLTSFSSGDVLTVYDANNSIFSVTVPQNGTGSGIANSDAVVFVSALSVNVSGNSFAVGDVVSDPVSNARAIILSINTVSSANSSLANTVILSVRPYANDLVGALSTSNSWTFNTGNSVYVNNIVGTINQIIGSGAQANLTTYSSSVSANNSGVINFVTMTSQGNGYFVPPYVTVQSANQNANVTNINLTALNYAAQINVASNTQSGSSPPVGSGYAFGVSKGVIYQKGYFLYVYPQIVVVNSYSTSPDGVMVGFNTAESIINSDVDQSLLDNATGTPNAQAPGADRLQLVPVLTVISNTAALSNADFFPLTAFSQGQPYLQNKNTAYSKIEAEMASRTYDTNGNFVLDPFQITSSVVPLASNVANAYTQSQTFNVVTDPGTAYIDGYKVQTFFNYNFAVNQGIDTSTKYISTQINYGNYILLNNLGGVFNYTTGDYVTLYDTAKNFLGNVSAYSTGNTSPVGNAIGTARIRNFVPTNGVPGTPTATYKLYLYDINLNSGQNLSAAKSVYYSNTFTGIADIVLTFNASANAYVCQATNSTSSSMVFNAGGVSTKSSNNISYVYTGIINAVSSGTITLNLGAGNQIFPYLPGQALNSGGLQTISVSFPNAPAQAASYYPGTVYASNSSNVVIANSGTSSFLTTYYAGQYLKIGGTDIRRVSAVINSTALQLDSAPATTNGVANTILYFPQYVNLDTPAFTANLDTTAKILTISLGANLSANANVSVCLPIVSTNATPATKTTNRYTAVKLNLSNNSGNTVGPWNLGVPDIFRLKSVYLDSNTNVLAANSIPNTAIDVTNHFYINHNQNPDFYDNGQLYISPGSPLTLNSNNGLIVLFDNFTVNSGGTGYFYTIGSYPIDDTQTYQSLNSVTTGGKINTNEIPELFDAQGNDIDLIDFVDFRPRVSTTANVTANVAAATVNPPVLSATAKYGSLLNTGFPINGSSYTSQVTNYLGRLDRVVVLDNGIVESIPGVPGSASLEPPPAPVNAITINYLLIPPYPSIPVVKDDNLTAILDKKISNRYFTATRLTNHTISIPAANSVTRTFQPLVYTMEDIAALDRRINALEYYASLSQLEQSATALTIPSAITPGVNRYKYGIFADSFLTQSYAAITDPGFSTTIVNETITPRQTSINIPMKFNLANTTTANAVTGSMLTLPYTEVEKINQSYVTTGDVLPFLDYPDYLNGLWIIQNGVNVPVLIGSTKPPSSNVNTITNVSYAVNAVSNTVVQTIVGNTVYNNIPSVLANTTSALSISSDVTSQHPTQSYIGSASSTPTTPLLSAAVPGTSSSQTPAYSGATGVYNPVNLLAMQNFAILGTPIVYSGIPQYSGYLSYTP